VLQIKAVPDEKAGEVVDLPGLPWRRRVPAMLRHFFSTSGEDVPLGTLWDLAPSPDELRRPTTYLRGLRLWEHLFGGGYTMLSARRGRTLYRLAVEVSAHRVAGALIDCGVWNGGSTVLLAAGAPEREVWAFDSFEGLPAPGALDEQPAWWAGEVRGYEEMLREAMRECAPRSDLHVMKGWFEETFPVAERQIDDVAVLHADGDWYDSVRLTLEVFYPKLARGGYVVIDDYGGFKGARRATDEFRDNHRIRAPMTRVDYTGVYWRKP
jgi:hypothetical protein